jgi:TonB family protein
MLKATFLLAFILAFSLISTYGQVRLSPEDSDKLIIEKAAPVYPSFAKLMKHQGTVKVEITVSESGEVVSSKVIEGNPTLRSAALDTVKKWKYKPYVVDGKPTPFVTTLDIVFSLGIPEDEIKRDQEVSKRYFEQEDKCRDLLRSRNLKEAETVCKAAAQMAEQLSSDRALEKMGAYELIGHVFLHQQRYQEALDKYSRAFEFARLKLKDKNAEMGQLYGYLAIAHHGMNNLEKAREFYKKAEKSLQLAYADMACDNCDEEVSKIRQDYIKTLMNLLEYHLVAAQQAGAAAEVEEIKKLKQSLPK